MKQEVTKINLTTDKMYISINDTLYTVLPLTEDVRPVKGVGYIYKDHVYIYEVSYLKPHTWNQVPCIVMIQTR